MAINRKAFIRGLCLTGTCLCGFSSVAISAHQTAAELNQEQDNNQILQEMISTLLANMDKSLRQDEVKKLLKNCSIIHYNNLGMDHLLENYKGDLEAFIHFIQDQWGWKIEYDKTTNTLVADENRDYCVCPMLSKENKLQQEICYCSEGFAELMFSAVAQVAVSACVISSVRRGDPTCKYKIEFS